MPESYGASQVYTPTKMLSQVMVVENGCIRPIFQLSSHGPFTSGMLKYLFDLEGKRVRVVLEVIE